MPTYPNMVGLFNPVDRLTYYAANFVDKLLQFLAALIVALVLVIIGYFVAKILEFAVKWLIKNLKVNEALKSLGFDKWLEKANIELQTEIFLGTLTFWVVWILFWMPAFEVLGLNYINDFIFRIVNFLPIALVAGLIVVVSIFVGDFVKRLSFTWFRSLELKGAKAASEVVFYSIVVFGVIAALSHLGVARDVLNILVGGIILAFALGTGLALGLGGQDLARDFLSKLRDKLE